MREHIDINRYNYTLDEERIAKFPLENRSDSKLLVWRDSKIQEQRFADISDILPSDQLVVFNNTKVIRARIIMHKPSGARIEVFCLEPHAPADYERALSQQGTSSWRCIVGNLKRWKEGYVEINFEYEGEQVWLRAHREGELDGHHIVRFEWNAPLAFGQMLEHLGRLPIPPYLNRDTEQIDYSRYQTVYSKFEGSVAAPTAGLHFTPEIIEQMSSKGIGFEELTLHVGAGTFLPVKEENAANHTMHTEHFEVKLSSVERLLNNIGRITAVGTTSVRTLESLVGLGWRISTGGDPRTQEPIGQWELYDIESSFSGEHALEHLRRYMVENNLLQLKAATQIMITPHGFRFRIVENIITNFHQPKSTLLLLVSAFVGDDKWSQIYDFALEHNFRFLSYGDSSLLMRKP